MSKEYLVRAIAEHMMLANRGFKAKDDYPIEWDESRTDSQISALIEDIEMILSYLEDPKQEPEEEPVLSIEYEWIPGSIINSFTFVTTLKSDSNIVTASDISWTYNISATWESGTESYSDTRIGNSPNFEIVSVGPTVPDTTAGSISATWNGQTVSIVLPE